MRNTAEWIAAWAPQQSAPIDQSVNYHGPIMEEHGAAVVHGRCLCKGCGRTNDQDHYELVRPNHLVLTHVHRSHFTAL